MFLMVNDILSYVAQSKKSKKRWKTKGLKNNSPLFIIASEGKEEKFIFFLQPNAAII